MNALSIAFKDLQIFVKDRGNVFQLILLPLIFILVIAGAFNEINSESEDALLVLPIVNLDSGEQAQDLLDRIQSAGGVQIELLDQEQAGPAIDDGEVQRLLTIPAEFSDRVSTDLPVTLTITNQADASNKETEAIRLVVEGAAQDLVLERQIFASLEQMAAMQATAPDAYQDAFSFERIKAQASSQFTQAEQRPLVTVKQSLPRQEQEQEEQPSYSLTAVPGFTVLFVFLTAQMTAQSIYDEKKVGSFRRLLAAPLSKASLLVGKVLPNFLLGIIQIAVIFAFGSFVLDWIGFISVPAGKDFLALVLTGLVIAFCSSALGIVIASLARTEGQIGGLSSLLLWGLGIVGGSIIPVFVLDQILGPVPKFIPHYWANRALNDVMIRGLGLADVLPDLGILLGFTAIFFAIGLWRFDFD